MMRYLCCSERTLQRCLNELETAGEITIENGSGGRTLRKIRLTRLQPIYPDKNDGVNPDKNDGGNKNNRKRKSVGAKAPSATRDEIIQWFNRWVTEQELPEKDALALITDLHDFVENRETLDKPFNTLKAAARMGGRLKTLSKDSPHPVPLMRYLLNISVIRNWSDVFPLKPEDEADFHRFLASEYGITVGAADGGSPDYF